MTDLDKLSLYRDMLRIRLIEEEIADQYHLGKMRCPTHLSIGQEAVPVAVSRSLNDDDFAVSTHRGHAHYLAKGGDLKSMIAEIHGKESGCSRGRGGSMHLVDRSVGFVGTSAIVGNSIPIGVGLGLQLKIKRPGTISCVYLGDGATEEGVYYESLNFAALKALPVLFVCENNFYSVYSPLNVRQPPERSIASVAREIGVPSQKADGNDVVNAQKIIQNLVSEIREGSGPRLIEFDTYRWREHCGPNYDDDLGYRSEEEINFWREHDPIMLLRQQLVQEIPEFSEVEKNLEKVIKIEISEAFHFAEISPFPNQSQAYIGEYA